MLHGTTLINGRSRRLSHPVTGMGRAARRRRLGDGPLLCGPAGSHPFPPRLRRILRQILLVIAFIACILPQIAPLSSTSNGPWPHFSGAAWDVLYPTSGFSLIFSEKRLPERGKYTILFV